jgi:hypothetical protein
VKAVGRRFGLANRAMRRAISGSARGGSALRAIDGGARGGSAPRSYGGSSKHTEEGEDPPPPGWADLGMQDLRSLGRMRQFPRK